jgi:hypothetical protein
MTAPPHVNADHTCALLWNSLRFAATLGCSACAGILISPRMTSDHYTTSLVGSLQACRWALNNVFQTLQINTEVGRLRTLAPGELASVDIMVNSSSRSVVR